MSDDRKNTTKIEVGLDPEVLGKIDLLIEEGLYDDQTSFLENAIKQLLEVHNKTIENYKVKNNFVIGIVNYSSKELEKAVADNKKLNIKVIGALSLSDDVSPDLAEKAIEKIRLAGVFKASEPVKMRLASKQFTLLGRPKTYLLKDSQDDKQE